MRSYNCKEISEMTGGVLKGPAEGQISNVIIDSRKFSEAEFSIFFAIKGERNDGHDYIPELIRKGLHCFVVQHSSLAERFPEASFIIVEDTLIALQKLAAAVRRNFQGTIVGITGSNGKTIVKEWLFQVMSGELSMMRSPMSYNSQVGVPLSLFLLEDDQELALIEAGISKPGEMARLEEIIRPDAGMITNIGEAHQENFHSLDEKLTEKLRLFSGAKKIYYCKDYKLIDQYIKELPSECVSWGIGEESDYTIRIDKKENNTTIHIHNDQPYHLTVPYTDDASLENIIHVVVFMLDSGYSWQLISKSVSKLEPVEMRLEILKGINGCTLINDSYNSDILSLSNALDVLNHQKQNATRTVIISDILQSGRAPSDLYKEVAALTGRKKVDHLIGIGNEISAFRNYFNPGSRFFDSTAEFLDQMDQMAFRNAAILLKGSRKFHFELISRALQEKTHRTVLEIDLDALIWNYRYYKSLLDRSTKVMAMVKAFSYGSGAYEVASLLQYHHVDYLAVAFTDEGVVLRKNGIHIPVMVMNPEVSDYFLITEYDLEPELYDFRVLDQFDNYLRRNGLKNYPVHIKIDTGMHRLGFEEKELDDLILRLKNSSFRIVSIFSHLAASDEEKHDDFTSLQLERFDRISQRINHDLGIHSLRHILNSSGIERFPEGHFNMVRLGIGLYGISEWNQDKLKAVASFKSKIAQIRELAPGETVGYGRKAEILERKRIATIPVGYADGLPRVLSNGIGNFVINHHLAPIIGNICMDMTMVDVTGIEAREGDEVLIFGKDQLVGDLAKAAGTIPYEILTGVSERVKRIYYQE